MNPCSDQQILNLSPQISIIFYIFSMLPELRLIVHVRSFKFRIEDTIRIINILLKSKDVSFEFKIITLNHKLTSFLFQTQKTGPSKYASNVFSNGEGSFHGIQICSRSYVFHWYLWYKSTSSV